MDIHSIRQALRTKSVYDIPLRVTFYARVSSESDEQLNSLGNQVSYYEELIGKNARWTYVDGYIDVCRLSPVRFLPLHTTPSNHPPPHGNLRPVLRRCFPHKKAVREVP